MRSISFSRHAAPIAVLFDLLGGCQPGDPAAEPLSGTTAVPFSVPPTGFDVPLVSLGGLAYTTGLTIGGQTFAHVVDTGSATTGVAFAGCASCTGLDPLYTPSADATDRDLTASSTYGDGSHWTGEIWVDAAALPGLPPVDLDFVAIQSQDSFFRDNSWQGILGLGPTDLLSLGTTSYVDVLADEGLPAQMAFRLCPDDGDLWMGGFDPDAAARDPDFTPMLPIGRNNPFYAVRLAGVALGASRLAVDGADFGEAILDTGTSLAYVPSGARTALLAAINGDPSFRKLFASHELSGSGSGDCVSAPGVTAATVDAELPALSLVFPGTDGGRFSVELPPSRSYLFDMGRGESGEVFCWAIGETRGGFSLLGDVILRGMLTVFDVESERVGFAPVEGCDAAGERGGAPVERDVRWDARPHFRAPPVR